MPSAPANASVLPSGDHAAWASVPLPRRISSRISLALRAAMRMGVAVGMVVGVSVGPGVSVDEGVNVGVGSGVSVGTAVGVSVGSGVGVKVSVGGTSVAVLVDISVIVGSNTILDVGVSVIVGSSTMLDVGVSVGPTASVLPGAMVGDSVSIVVGSGELMALCCAVPIKVAVGIVVGVSVELGVDDDAMVAEASTDPDKLMAVDGTGLNGKVPPGKVTYAEGVDPTATSRAGVGRSIATTITPPITSRTIIIISRVTINTPRQPRYGRGAGTTLATGWSRIGVGVGVGLGVGVGVGLRAGVRGGVLAGDGLTTGAAATSGI